MNANFQTFKQTDKVRILIGPFQKEVAIRVAIRDLYEVFLDDEENFRKIVMILQQLDVQRLEARQKNALSKKPINENLPDILKVGDVNVCLLLVPWTGVRKVSAAVA